MVSSLARSWLRTACIVWFVAGAPAMAQTLAIDSTLPAASYSTYALSKDAKSFDPEDPENKLLLEKGFGFPVRVARVLEGRALVASPATKLLIPVPLGWRGFDDARRTRLFPPGGDIGLVVSVVSIDDTRGWDDTREQFWQQVREAAARRGKESPRYEARLIRLADGTFGVREAHIPDKNGPYSSILLVMRYPGDARLGLRINLFTPVEEFERYVGLMGLIVRDLQGGSR
jgi:hypothetical protein